MQDAAPVIEDFLQAQEPYIPEPEDSIEPSQQPIKPSQLWQETVYSFKDVNNHENLCQWIGRIEQ